MKPKNDVMPNGKTRLRHNLYNSQWAQNNRDKVNVYHQKWMDRRREWYFKLKRGKSCVACGESHPACLDFHHINPKLKTGIIRMLSLYSNDNDRVIKEIKNCILLCANCHRKQHYKDRINKEINDAGYRGLYGMPLNQVEVRKGVKKGELLDRAGTTELAANLFRITQTDDKIRKDNIRGDFQASQTHFMVGGKVRQTIKDIGGTTPENLPAERHIRELKSEKKKLLKDKNRNLS